MGTAGGRRRGSRGLPGRRDGLEQGPAHAALRGAPVGRLRPCPRAAGCASLSPAPRGAGSEGEPGASMRREGAPQPDWSVL